MLDVNVACMRKQMVDVCDRFNALSRIKQLFSRVFSRGL